MKINEIITRISKNKKAAACIRGLLTIGLVTAVSAISVHYLTGNTLSQYAEENPELAYGTSSTDESPEATSTGETQETTSSDETQEAASTGETSDNPSEKSSSENTSPEVSTQTTDIVHEDSQDSKSEANIGPMVHFYDPAGTGDGRTVYSEGFYYEPLTEEMTDYITGSSFPDDDTEKAISTDDLYYVGIMYHDFSDVTQAGELICNKSIAPDLAEIFSQLYDADYRFEKIALVDNYGGDDTASMSADNTSCFNYRVVEGSTHLSKHAYGLAIDINPFYNPYIVFGGNDDGSDYISPAGSEIYADRTRSFPYKIDPDDLCYRLFTEHGFIWGGNWNSCKDYQHFEKKD